MLLLHIALLYFILFVAVPVTSKNEEFDFLSMGKYLDSIVNNHDKNLLLVPLTNFGLANRLRTMASALIIAKALHRHLVVLWAPSIECNIHFHDLFNITTSSDFDLKLDYEVHSLDFKNLGDGEYAKSVYNGLLKYVQTNNITSLHINDFMLKSIKNSTSKAMISWSVGFHTLESLNCYEFLNFKSSFYKSLRPSNSIVNLIKPFQLNRFIGYPVIGIHVRAYYETYDAPVVPPFLDNLDNTINTISHNNALRFDQVSPLSSFLHFINTTIQNNPYVRFFVASNNDYVKTMILNTYGSKTIFILQSPNTTSGNRSNRESMLLAIAEFLLLSETSFIVHTRGSSFAMEAAAIHMKSVIDVSYYR